MIGGKLERRGERFVPTRKWYERRKIGYDQRACAYFLFAYFLFGLFNVTEKKENHLFKFQIIIYVPNR